jgi:hypothetical protein
MSTTLFPELLPDTDRADDYTPLKKGDGDHDSNDTEISDISPEYTEVSESTTDENTEDTD